MRSPRGKAILTADGIAAAGTVTLDGRDVSPGVERSAVTGTRSVSRAAAPARGGHDLAVTDACANASAEASSSEAPTS
jgi:hypothetical protein